jgi:hypothetical protein
MRTNAWWELDGGTERRDSDLDEPSAWRNTLRFVSLVDCIMRWGENEGCLPTLYSSGVGLQVALYLSWSVTWYVFARTTISSISNQIILCNQGSFTQSCGARRLVSCPTRLDLVGWASPRSAAYVQPCGYTGLYPHSNCSIAWPEVCRSWELGRLGVSGLKSLG